MPEILRFGPGGLREVGGQQVYTRANWEDDWDLVEDLHCLEAVWSVAPSLPTATLSWLYGSIKQVGSDSFESFLKKELNRLYVRVDFETQRDEDDDWTLRPWYGIIEITSDQLGGAVVVEDDDEDPETETTVTASGEQLFSCYGIGKLLIDHIVRDAYWWDGVEAQRTELPPAFNAGGRPNRTATPPLAGVHLFEPDPDAAEYWSTADIVDYLLSYQVPVGPDELPAVVFQATGASVGWDRPEVEQHRQSTYGLLDQLLNRRRLLSWRLERHTDDSFNLVVETLNHVVVNVPLPGGGTLPANSRQRHWVFDEDQLTSVSIKDSEVEIVDQVIVRGARRRSVGTFAVDGNELEEGWTASEELTYQFAASTSTDYAALGVKDRQKRNAEVRGSLTLENAYSLFRIPKGWDGTVCGTVASVPLFPLSDDGTSGFPVYYPELIVEQSLPLIEGKDYSADEVALGTQDDAEGEEMPPIVVLQRPDLDSQDSVGRWVRVESIAETAQLEISDSANEFNSWSASVYVPRGRTRTVKGVRLVISGAPKHVLAGAFFFGLPEDEYLGAWSYASGSMLVTLSLLDERFAEGVHPITLPSTDYHKIKILDAGDGYRKDYVAPGTVVGVDQTGQLLRSTGGFIPRPGPDDDEAYLKAIAVIAAGYYTVPHSIVQLRTFRMPTPAELELGDMVVEIGDDRTPQGHRSGDVNSVVTQLVISFPRGDVDRPAEPELRATTWAGELDAIGLLPPTTEEV